MKPETGPNVRVAIKGGSSQPPHAFQAVSVMSHPFETPCFR